MPGDIVKCPACGGDNPRTSAECRFCGHSMRGDMTSESACPACGWDAEKGAVVCPSCGTNIPHRHEPEQDNQKVEECEHWSELPSHSVRTAKVGVAGILVLLAGFLGITHGLLSVLPGTGDNILSTYESAIGPGEALDEFLNSYDVFAVFMLACGVIAVALTTFTFNRTRLDASIASAVFGILSIGFLFGAFFALLGLLLIVTSRREFLPECR